LQVIDAADKADIKWILVICPASVLTHWQGEFEKHQKKKRTIIALPDSDSVEGPYANVCITTWDLAAKHATPLKRVTWDLVVFDEAHRLKSMTSQRAQKLIGKESVVHHARRVWLLSGTPAPNHPGELYPCLRVFLPDAIRDLKGQLMGEEAFIRQNCYVQSTPYGLRVTKNKPDQVEKLRSHLRGFMLRREPEAGMMPDILYSDLVVTREQLPPQEDALALRKDALNEVIDHSLPFDEDGTLSEWRRECGLLKIPAVIQAVNDVLEDGARKVIIFAWHLNVIAQYQFKFPTAAVITGEVPTSKRPDQMKRFQTDDKCRVFIGQMLACGEGISLSAGRDVFMAEYSWVPKDIAQAVMRPVLMGAPDPVSVRFAKLAGSLDEQFVTTLRRKTSMITELLSKETTKP
jgi:SNF2 family DNA or RNA helicase